MVDGNLSKNYKLPSKQELLLLVLVTVHLAGVREELSSHRARGITERVLRFQDVNTVQ